MTAWTGPRLVGDCFRAKFLKGPKVDTLAEAVFAVTSRWINYGKWLLGSFAAVCFVFAARGFQFRWKSFDATAALL